MEAIALLTGLFDSLLGLGLLWLAWRALTCPELFQAIVLFVIFGLLMVLAWVRLDAPDVALAEAAIGTGLTGALLMAALAKLRSTGADGESIEQNEIWTTKARSLKWLTVVALLSIVTVLGYIVLLLPPHAMGLSIEVTANLQASGVSNPVTAVLLNFRGYDTLLEMAVLLLALMGVWSLGGKDFRREATPGPVLNALAGLLVPLLILVAAYLLWVGAHAPGGAFQAGSVLGAAGVILLLAGKYPRAGLATQSLRFLLVVGPGAFVVMAALLYVFEGQLLKYPPAQAGILILVLETVATISIGITLVALFLGRSPHNNKDHT